MTGEAVEGGCLCGAVRYRADGPLSDSSYCHCRTCRRASGAPVVAWITVPRARFTITAGAPQHYRSSEQVVRSFCPRCGTALTYATDRAPGAIDVTTASLDEPERFAPEDHVWTSHAIGWLRIDDALPRHAESRASEG
jgi:hypothetical protein